MHVTAGYAPIMPTYQGQISEEGLIDLVEYIKKLELELPYPADADIPPRYRPRRRRAPTKYIDSGRAMRRRQGW